MSIAIRNAMFRSKIKRDILAIFISTILLTSASAEAESDLLYQKDFKPIILKSIYGQAGTLTTPNARHFRTGTIHAHAASLDPYSHYVFGAQLLDGFHAQFRQTAEMSSLFDDADWLTPGIDLKIRLLKESRYKPELSLGLISAIGHKRQSGEYIAASKRYKDFDFTAGLGWGRFGTAKHFDNPFSAFGDHFDQQRTLDGEDASSPDDWFTGKNIGFFGSLVWHSPIKGLSLSADYGADRYTIEKEIIEGFDAPSPYSVGINYSPTDWLNLSLGLSGTEKVMGQISLSPNIKSLNTGHSTRGKKHSLPNRIIQKITGNEELVYLPETSYEDYILDTQYDNNIRTIHLETAGRHETLPYLIGQTNKDILSSSYADLQAIETEVVKFGLRGPKIKLLSKELKNTEKHISSAEEIWHSAQISKEPFKAKKQKLSMLKRTREFLSFTLENHVSLSEEDNGTYTRTALLMQKTFPITQRLLNIHRLRGTLYHNLDGLNTLRRSDNKSVRGNVEDFTENGLIYDQFALNYNGTVKDNWYYAFTAGYLEEMYFGAGAEILYRPFDKTWAIGAELFDVAKRDPFSGGAYRLEGGSGVITGHLNAYYEPPNTYTTYGLSLGRYLDKDFGVSASINHEFENGSRLGGFVTTTNKQDTDIFGGSTHLYGGLNLSMPLGSLSFLPNGSSITLKTSPLGRNSGQRLDKPFDLFQETETLSRRHLIQHWSDIVK